MITNEQKELARRAMEYALKNGCQACRVGIYGGSETSFDVRDTQLDKLQQAEESQMVIYLFVDGRYGSISTNRMDKNELETFIRNGIASTRFLAEDAARQLPDASLYFKGGNDNQLELYDETVSTVSPDEKLKLANTTAAEIYGTDSRLISVTAGYSDGENFSYIVDSNGFEGSGASSSFGLSAEAAVKGDGDARPSSYWYDQSLFWSDLKKTDIGKKALERALQKIGQAKMKSGKYPMLVDNMVAGTLLRPVISALNGASLQQKNSFLLDKKGQKVVSVNMTLIDDPLMPKTIGAKCFDREGIASQKRMIFDKGVLNTYFIDTYNANKMKMDVTTGAPSVVRFELGIKNLSEMISKLDKAIYVTGFNGGNCNSSTGNFSYGMEGFWIEGGELKQPVAEMNITGDMLTLWSNLVGVGNDPVHFSSWQMPTLLFEGVDFSGL